MLNSNEKEFFKRIEKEYRKNNNNFSYMFKINVKEEEYNQNQEIKHFFEKCRNLGYLEIVEKYGTGGSKPDERWRIKITPEGSMYLNS